VIDADTTATPIPQRHRAICIAGLGKSQQNLLKVLLN